jgi:hypothetical protein
VTDAEGEAFMHLCGRLDAAQTDACRSALLLFLELAKAAPPDLSGPHLSVWILDRVRAALEPSPSPKLKKGRP